MITVTARNGIMAGIIEAGNIFDPAAVFIGVFTAINDQGINTAIADITRPEGTGFDLTAVTTWGAAHDKPDGRRMVDAPVKVFRPTDETEAATVIGWYAASAATAGNLLAFGYFDAPVALPDENFAVSVVYRLTVDPLGRWDATVEYNG